MTTTITMTPASISETAVTRPKLLIRNLHKHYGSYRALDDVSLDVRDGEFLALLGPSGSGKTTLLMTLAGFTRPDSGSILMDGQELVRTPPHRRNIGMVFQNYALFPHMTVGQNVAYPLKLRKMARPEISRLVAAALHMVQLGHVEERRIDALSGGQRQRVALARAMVFEPGMLLMDEPLSALDKKLREHMQIELRALHRRLGVTTIYVTHDQREALTMADRIAVINHGKVAQLDTPRMLYERPRSKFVADFIGESSFLPVDVSDGGASLYGVPLHLAEPVRAGHGPHFLVLRPEKVDLAAGPAAGLNVIEGALLDVVYQGDSVILQVRLPDGSTLAVRQPARQDLLAATPEPGQALRLALHPEDTVIVGDAA